ncbi:hypothetical protein [Streptomyces sp. NPDC056304]|uniref:hypothetical protein n=1 Tax=Streptomyces sp. NPDC056304 TaxID=3345778 RepID=UPI0035DED2FE
MKRQVSYQWRLRERMAAAGMFTTSELGQLEPIPQHFDGVWLTFYALAPDTVIGTAPDGTVMTAGDIQSHPHSAPLNWDNETVLAFGVPFGEREPDTTKEWAQVVYTAWQLMSQTGKTQLTEVKEVPRDRRDGITGPSDVRIRQRPHRSPTQPGRR